MAVVDRVQLIVEAQTREFPGLDYSAKAITGRLVRLGTLCIEAIERVAQRHGMSANEYVILCVLRAAGAPFMLPPKSIRPLLGLTSGGMTNILHDLEDRGMVERRPDPADRRGVLIRLTAQGVKSIGAAIEAHVLEEHRLLEGLSAKERDLLQSLLTMLLISVEPVTKTDRPSLKRAPPRRQNAL
jgi:DNA-binding MarR family transcriptional regulator